MTLKFKSDTKIKRAQNETKDQDKKRASQNHRRPQDKGKRIVFTNGCFDLLHIGHVRYLEKAKALGDVLVVGVNSDSSVRKLKGRRRPILPEQERAEILSGLGCVDYVTLFDEIDPLKLISSLQPDVLGQGRGLDKRTNRGKGSGRKVRGRSGHPSFCQRGLYLKPYRNHLEKI